MTSFNPRNTQIYSDLAHRLDTESAEAWQVHDQAMQMQKQGDDVVILSIGDPDFRTPQPIVDNAVSHMRVGRTHYSPALGELNLRRAVADYESRVSPLNCKVEEVSIYPGVTSAIFSVMSCLLNAGDEVIIVDPLYVGYTPIMNALNVSVKTITASSATECPQPDLAGISEIIYCASWIIRSASRLNSTHSK
jgi:arginine:pyruvate transaminase